MSSSSSSAPAKIPHHAGDRTFLLEQKMQVTIHHGADPHETNDVISVEIPADYHFSVPPHYHDRATEWMKIIEGEARGIVGGVEMVLKAGDDWLEIPPGTIHSFDKPGGPDGIKVTWLERAGPEPELTQAKKMLFEDLFGDGEQRGFVGSMAVFFRDGDGFIVLPGGAYTDWLSRGLIYVVGGLAHLTGLATPGRHMVNKDKTT